MSGKIKDNLSYTAINFFGSLLPVILLYIGFCINNDDWQSITTITDRGDILLISISMIVSATYTLYKIKDDNAWKGVFITFSILVGFFSAFIFGLVISKVILSNYVRNFTLCASIISIVWCLFVIYVSRHLYNLESGVSKNRTGQKASMKEKYDKRFERGQNG